MKAKGWLAAIVGAAVLTSSVAQAQEQEPEKYSRPARIFAGVTGGIMGAGAIYAGVGVVGGIASAPVAATVLGVGLVYVAGAVATHSLLQAITGREQRGFAKWSGLDAFQKGLIRAINVFLPEEYEEIPHGMYEDHVLRVGNNDGRHARTQVAGGSPAPAAPRGGASGAGIAR